MSTSLEDLFIISHLIDVHNFIFLVSRKESAGGLKLEYILFPNFSILCLEFTFEGKKALVILR